MPTHQIHSERAKPRRPVRARDAPPRGACARSAASSRRRTGARRKAPAAAAWSWSTAQPALSCLRKPEQMDGHDVVDARGASRGDAPRHERGVRARGRRPVRLLHSRHRRPRGVARSSTGETDDRDAIAKALDGHLCRCTGYGRIIDAIQTAGEAAANGGCAAAHRAAAPLVFRRRVRAAVAIPRSLNGNGTATATARHRDGRSIARHGRSWSRRWARSRSSTTCACPACCTARWCYGAPAREGS